MPDSTGRVDGTADPAFEDAPVEDLVADEPVLEEPIGDEPAAAASMPSRRRVGGVHVGARALTGVIGIAVAVSAITAATLVPFPTLDAAAPSVSVQPEPAAQQLVCPGAVLRLGDESGANATVASAIGTATTTSDATSGTLDSVVLADTGSGAGQGAPTLLSASAATTTIAGAQSQSVNTSDYRGLAAAECARPSSDSWLVGGSTATGRTTLLTLANPGESLSTVTIELFGESGVVDAAGTNGIVVAPGTQRVVSLAGFAPGLASLAVHVTSRGGPVVANLQQSIVRGIDAGGVDIISATKAAATSHVVPGVRILDSAGVQAAQGGAGYDDLGTIVRVFVPGAVDADATIRVLSAEDGVASSGFDLTLAAGVVTDVPIDELPDGSYTVVVETSVPTVTAVRASTINGDASDLAWFAAGDALTDSAFVSVANGDSAILELGNPGDAAASVKVGDMSVTVPAGSSVTVPVGDNQSYLVTGAEGIFGSVSYASPGRLASYLLGASATRQPPVIIYP